MNAETLLLEIEKYAQEQGVSFDVALTMLQMMYEDEIHLGA